LRQLCNLAYAVMVEGLDEAGRRELDDRLVTPPGDPLPPRSRGTQDLMRMLGPGGPARR
jgi:hypothetical protein